jgi:uncharacterized protein
LLDYEADWESLEQNENPFAIVTLAHLKTKVTHNDPESRKAWKFRLTTMLYERGYKKRDILELYNFLDYRMTLPVSLTQLLVPTYTQMLRRLSGWLKKAQEQRPKADAEALLSARLAPDMFPLSTQVRFACVQAQEAIFRLKGEAFPKFIDELLEEGRNAGDRPGSIADAQARIDETIALLDGLTPDALDVNANQPLAHELPNGMILDLSAEQYARDWALAQFYFHLMTAYSILRNQKIELGKADYVTHLFPYIRPETMPKG